MSSAAEHSDSDEPIPPLTSASSGGHLDEDDLSEPPELEENSDDSDEDVFGTGLGPSIYNGSSSSMSTHNSSTSRAVQQHAGSADGINRRSRIWQVPEGIDPHEHSLGPAAGEDDDHHHFAMPSVQVIPTGPGSGGQVVLSMPMPSSLASVRGMGGMGGHSRNNAPEPMFVPGGGLGGYGTTVRPAAAFRPAPTQGPSPPRQQQQQQQQQRQQWPQQAPSAMQLPAELNDLIMNAISGSSIPSGLFGAGGASAIPNGVMVGPARAGRAPGASRSTAPASSNGGTAASFPVPMPVPGGLVPGLVPGGLVPLAVQMPAAALHMGSAPQGDGPQARSSGPFSSSPGGGRHFLHARRTRQRTAQTGARAAAEGTGAAAADATAAFTFSAVPAAAAAPASEDNSVWEIQQRQQRRQVRVRSSTAVQSGLHVDGRSVADGSSSSSTVHTFRWWPPWSLFASGLRLLQRLLLGAIVSTTTTSSSSSCSSSSSSGVPAAASGLAALRAAAPLQPGSSAGNSLPAASIAGSAAGFPASFSLLDTEQQLSGSPARAPSDVSESRARRQQQENRAQAMREQRRRRQQQQQRRQRQQQHSSRPGQDSEDELLGDVYEPDGDAEQQAHRVTWQWPAAPSGSGSAGSGAVPPQASSAAVTAADGVAAAVAGPSTPAAAASPADGTSSVSRGSQKRGRLGEGAAAAEAASLSPGPSAAADGNLASSSRTAAAAAVAALAPRQVRTLLEPLPSSGSSASEGSDSPPPLLGAHTSSDASTSDNADSSDELPPLVRASDLEHEDDSEDGNERGSSLLSTDVEQEFPPELDDPDDSGVSDEQDSEALPSLAGSSDMEDDDKSSDSSRNDMPQLELASSEGDEDDFSRDGPRPDSEHFGGLRSGFLGRRVPVPAAPAAPAASSAQAAPAAAAAAAGASLSGLAAHLQSVFAGLAEEGSDDGHNSDHSSMPGLENDTDDEAEAASGRRGCSSRASRGVAAAAGHASGHAAGRGWGAAQDTVAAGMMQSLLAQQWRQQQQRDGLSDGSEQEEEGSDAYDDDDDDSQGSWETASDQAASVDDDEEEDDDDDDDECNCPACIQRRYSRRVRSAAADASSAAFSRARSNGFMVPGSSTLATTAGTSTAAVARAPGQQQQIISSSNAQRDGEQAVKGLPSLQRPRKAAAPAGSSSSTAVPAGLLSGDAARTRMEQLASALSDSSFTQQLLQGLPGVSPTDARVQAALQLLRSKQYVLACAATPVGRVKGRLVSFEESEFERNAERSTRLLQRWKARY